MFAPYVLLLRGKLDARLSSLFYFPVQAPSSDVIQTLLPGLCVEGTLLVLAIAEDVTVPLIPLITKRLTLRGWPSGKLRVSFPSLLATDLFIPL